MTIKEDLRYLDGPWRNDACIGYVLLAMIGLGFSDASINKVLNELMWCFDDVTVENAALYYMKFRTRGNDNGKSV